MPYWKTGISRAFWCGLTETTGSYFQPATWHAPDAAESEDICWLDHLLEGGLSLSGSESGLRTRSLTLLVSGSPGSGKSVLTMELCHRLARPESPSSRQAPLSCLYLSSESSVHQLQEQALSFGWDGPPSIGQGVFSQYTKGGIRPGIVSIIGSDDVEERFDRDPEPDQFMEKLIQEWQGEPPDILVIDSLNVFTDRFAQAKFFHSLSSKTTTGPKLVIVVIESALPNAQHDFWSYRCDFEFRLDRDDSGKYLQRTIEIIKARYQPHIWGKHQLKIYPGRKLGSMPADPITARKSHPYRRQGGVFIFPSIHYYLSVYKRSSPTLETRQVETSLPELDQALSGGIPSGRCTALIGARGGHKSHLSYVHVLSQLRQGKKALVITLRDDENMARTTMDKILNGQFNTVSDDDGPNSALLAPSSKRTVSSYESSGDLEIMYFPPGYIAAEEFFHRVFLAIRRIKSESQHDEITVLFNSLDQLSAHFPLCASENIFIPSLVNMFTAENITSIFVAVSEEGQPPEQYGLRPKADMILSFAYVQFNESDLDALPPEHGARTVLLGGKDGARFGGTLMPVVALRVDRMPAGEAAGAWGLLQLTSERGLQFTEMPRDFPAGERMQH